MTTIYELLPKSPQNLTLAVCVRPDAVVAAPVPISRDLPQSEGAGGGGGAGAAPLFCQPVCKQDRDPCWLFVQAVSCGNYESGTGWRDYVWAATRLQRRLLRRFSGLALFLHSAAVGGVLIHA